MLRFGSLASCTFMLILAAAAPSPAWWIKGHGLIAEAACKALPDDMPPFFRAAGKTLNHLAGEPDRYKNRAAEFLRVSEAPDHYIDLEEYGGETLPRNRFRALELARRRGVAPDKAGFLPYALMEHFDRLTLAFGDYRRDPTNEAVRLKCIAYAGVLSHYTGDACMPLHATRDYDGRPGLDGRIQQKGIHAKIDGFPETHGFSAEEISRDVIPTKIDDVWRHSLDVIQESFHNVERCYEIDIAGGFDKPSEASRAFIMNHCRRGARFTAELWYNAWLKSATLPAPY